MIRLILNRSVVNPQTGQKVKEYIKTYDVRDIGLQCLLMELPNRFNKCIESGVVVGFEIIEDPMTEELPTDGEVQQ